MELKYMLHNGISSCSMGNVTAFRLYNQCGKSSISKLENDLYCLLQSNENECPHYFSLECSSWVSNIKKEADNLLHFSAEMKGNLMVQSLVIGYHDLPPLTHLLKYKPWQWSLNVITTGYTAVEFGTMYFWIFKIWTACLKTSTAFQLAADLAGAS